MKVLFTTPILEYPPAGGPFLRIKNSIKALNFISDLYVISRVTKTGIGGQKADEYYRRYCKEMIYLPVIKLSKKNVFLYRMKKIKKILFGLNRKKYSFDDYVLSRSAKFIIKYAKKYSIDLIWAGYGNISYPIIREIKRQKPNLKIICDTDSVWSRFVLRALPYEKNIEKIKKIRDEGLKKEKEERELVELCDLTTAVSDVDSQYYKSLTKNKNKIKLFSNVIDLDDYEKEEKSPGLNKPNVYLAGTFWPGSPMENAARWFVNNVFEIIKKEIPAIHFYILGRDSDKILSDMKDENIIILGRVDNASFYLKDSDVAIVPLFFESGTRFKILEAGACGVPLVSTVLGAEGLPVESGRDILLADDPQDFANAVIKLIRNKKFANRIAQNCRELVCEKYGLEKLKAEGRQILDYF